MSARVVWATTVELNCSKIRGAARAMRSSESRAIFFATVLSSMALTVSRSWYAKSSISELSFAFKLLGARLLLDAAFDLDPRLLARELALALLQRLALDRWPR